MELPYTPSPFFATHVRMLLSNDADPFDKAISIRSAFYWAGTPEGHQFWSEECEAVLKGKSLSEKAQAALARMADEVEDTPA